MTTRNLLQCVCELFGTSASVDRSRRRQHALPCAGIESLEARRVPAAVVQGNLEIVGSNVVDKVKVEDTRLNGVDMIRVTHNGAVQNFRASSVTGMVKFWGNGADDSFNYVGQKSCYANGGSGNDFLSSDSGKDLLIGGTGNDTLEGWSGKDELQGGDGNDVLRGGGDNDLLFGQNGNDSLDGSSGNDELQGGNGNDVLAGGSGNDLLFGQAGDDLLGGEDGDDSINGGTGMDIAFGGRGFDRFWECNDVAFFLTSFETRFGTASHGGIQDATGNDRVF